MTTSTPLLQMIVPAVLIAAVMALINVRLGLFVLIGLILFGAIVKGIARRSESGRWLSTGVYTGALVGFVVSILRGNW